MGSRYESNSKVLWRYHDVHLFATGNLVRALGRLDDEVLDDSGKKQIDLLLSQQFTKT